jgi:hypothetical protein
MQPGQKYLPPFFAQSQQRPDIDRTKTGPGAAFGRIQPVAVIGFLAGEVNVAVDLLVVDFLVEGQSVNTRLL